jgi:hypothetical protein
MHLMFLANASQETLLRFMHKYRSKIDRINWVIRMHNNRINKDNPDDEYLSYYSNFDGMINPNIANGSPRLDNASHVQLLYISPEEFAESEAALMATGANIEEDADDVLWPEPAIGIATPAVDAADMITVEVVPEVQIGFRHDTSRALGHFDLVFENDNAVARGANELASAQYARRMEVISERQRLEASAKKKSVADALTAKRLAASIAKAMKSTKGSKKSNNRSTARTKAGLVPELQVGLRHNRNSMLGNFDLVFNNIPDIVQTVATIGSNLLEGEEQQHSSVVNGQGNQQQQPSAAKRPSGARAREQQQQPSAAKRSSGVREREQQQQPSAAKRPSGAREREQQQQQQPSERERQQPSEVYGQENGLSGREKEQERNAISLLMIEQCCKGLEQGRSHNNSAEGSSKSSEEGSDNSSEEGSDNSSEEGSDNSSEEGGDNSSEEGCDNSSEEGGDNSSEEGGDNSHSVEHTKAQPLNLLQKRIRDEDSKGSTVPKRSKIGDGRYSGSNQPIYFDQLIQEAKKKNICGGSIR